MFTSIGIFARINVFFRSFSALLYVFATKNGIEVPTDLVIGKPGTNLLFPEIAFNYLTLIPSVISVLGLTAATFATKDSAFTALTTSFCVDFLGMGKTENLNKPNEVRNRRLVHIAFSFLMIMAIIYFNAINDSSVVGMIFTVASYTYDPLLGLYCFGLFVKSKTVKDKFVPSICLLSPAVTYFISENSKT